MQKKRPTATTPYRLKMRIQKKIQNNDIKNVSIVIVHQRVGREDASDLFI